MESLDPSAASYVTRHISPDGRTVLDLVMVFEPEDFRELGGEQRARVYDGTTGETVLDLLSRRGRATSFEWSPKGELLLTMANGATICVSLARDIYSLSTDGWVPHPLADIQAAVPDHLGLPEPTRAPEPAPRAPAGVLRKIGYGLVVAAVVVLFILSMLDGPRPHYIHFPRALRGVH